MRENRDRRRIEYLLEREERRDYLCQRERWNDWKQWFRNYPKRHNQTWFVRIRRMIITEKCVRMTSCDISLSLCVCVCVYLFICLFVCIRICLSFFTATDDGLKFR
jgi:hypothetical protein